MNRTDDVGEGRARPPRWPFPGRDGAEQTEAGSRIGTSVSFPPGPFPREPRGGTMNQSKTRTAWILRLSAVTAVLAVLAASCTTSPGGGGNPAPLQQFCDFFEEVSQDPPEAEETVLVKDDVVAMAEATTVTGAECTDPNAEVDLDQALLAEGEEIPSELNNPASEPIAAITGDEIAGGD